MQFGQRAAARQPRGPRRPCNRSIPAGIASAPRIVRVQECTSSRRNIRSMTLPVAAVTQHATIDHDAGSHRTPAPTAAVSLLSGTWLMKLPSRRRLRARRSARRRDTATSARRGAGSAAGSTPHQRGIAQADAHGCIRAHPRVGDDATRTVGQAVPHRSSRRTGSNGSTGRPEMRKSIGWRLVLDATRMAHRHQRAIRRLRSDCQPPPSADRPAPICPADPDITARNMASVSRPVFVFSRDT